MSRFEGELKAGHEAEIDVRELLVALGHNDSAERTQAVARYLSGAEDWDDAMRQLDGAFAPARPPSASRGGQGE